MTDSSKTQPYEFGTSAQEYLDKTMKSSIPLSEEESKIHQQLLRNDGLVWGTGEGLKTPPNHRFAPIPTKVKK